MEAVSRYCQQHKTSHTLGDGSAEICFSKRSDTKYEEFRNYMDKLKSISEANDVQIDWSIIKSEQITALSSKLMGMQIADAVASSFFFSTQLNQYGFAEEKYVKMLKPVVYHHKGRYSGYGLKIWPNEAHLHIKTESHLAWLPESYNF